jgi:hypothetical protein
MRSLSPEPHLGALQNFFFALLEDGFVVLRPCTQSLKYDPNRFVGGSSDGLRFPSFRQIRLQNSPM